MHMISKKDLSSAEMDTLTKSCSPTIVMTANGEVDRLRPISFLANFWMLNFGTTTCCGAPEGWGAQNFALFFLPPTTIFFLLSLSRDPFVEFWWCLKRRGPEMCTFGVLRLSCASPGGPVWWGLWGFHTTAREPKCAHFRVPGFQTHQQNSTKGPQERKKNENCGGRREKKSEILGGPAEGCPAEGCPAEGGRGPEGSIRNGVQGSGFRVQFMFLGTKTETEQKQNEERDE